MKKQYMKVFRHMNTLHEIYRVQDGSKVYKKHADFDCEFFIPSKSETIFTDLIDKQYLEQIKCESFKDFKEKKEMYNGLRTTYGSIKPENQFRRKEYYKKEIFTEPRTCFFDIETGFSGSYMDADNNLVPGSGFPKPEHANAPILSISLCYNDKYVVLSLKEFKEKLIKDAKYYQCESEEDMLETFFKLLKHWDIDTLAGWNTNNFDYPFIINRMKKFEMDLKQIDHIGLIEEDKHLGIHRPKSLYWMDYMDLYKKFTFVPRESYSLQAIAEAELGEGKVEYHDSGDLQEIYNDSFKLFLDYNIKDTALMVDLDKKISLMALAYQMAYMYNVNFDEILGTTSPWTQLLYCETRSTNIILPDRQESEAMGFEGGYVYCKPGYYDWIVSFDFASLYPSLIRAYNICPSSYIKEKNIPEELLELRRKLKISDTTEGIQVQLDWSKETKEEVSRLLKKYNVSMSPTGHFFSIEKQGVFPYLMESVYTQRKAAKKLMTAAEKELEIVKTELKKQKTPELELKKEKLAKDISTYNNQQMALKIAINSAYGAMSSEYFLLSKKAIGESITSTGRLADRKAAYEVDKVLTSKFDYNEEGSTVACMDTDSAYFDIGPVVKKYCENIDEKDIPSYITDKIVPIITTVIKKNALKDLSETYNMLDRNVLDMEHEVTGKAIFTAKKNYVIDMKYKEGVYYPDGKFKITGLQIKKTNIPAFVREKMKDFLKILFSGDETKFHKEFAKFKTEFMSLPVSDISFPKGVNFDTDSNRKGNVDGPNGRYYYTLQSVGLPVNVRAALVYNEYITKKCLTGKYNIIENGSKIKFVYLKNDGVIGYPNDRHHEKFVEENDFVKDIDYEKMFEGIVVKPLDPLVNALGWNYKRTNKLSDFF